MRKSAPKLARPNWDISGSFVVEVVIQTAIKPTINVISEEHHVAKIAKIILIPNEKKQKLKNTMRI